MSIHQSTETHVRLLEAINGRIDEGGEFLEWDVRAALVTQHVNPMIEIVIGPGESIRPDGVVQLRLPQNDHITWRVSGFQIAHTLSLSPTTEYRNGKQIVAADGTLAGHAHLHFAKLSEWHAAARAVSAAVAEPLPPSYRFRGGPEWYRTIKQADGSALIMAKKDIAAEPRVLYHVEIELVHVDDTQISPQLHGQPSVGRLASIVEFIE